MPSSPVVLRFLAGHAPDMLCTFFPPGSGELGPGVCSVPDSSEPSIAKSAPAAKDLTISPLVRIPPSAIIFTSPAKLGGSAVKNRLKGGDPMTCLDSGRADGASTDADLNGVSSPPRQVFESPLGCYIPSHDVDVWIFLSDSFNRLLHHDVVAVGDIEAKYACAFEHQQFCPIKIVSPHSDCCGWVRRHRSLCISTQPTPVLLCELYLCIIPSPPYGKHGDGHVGFGYSIHWRRYNRKD